MVAGPVVSTSSDSGGEGVRVEVSLSKVAPQDAAPLIEPLRADSFADFSAYWFEHVAENGSAAAGWFQPQPRGSVPSASRVTAFREGLAIALADVGWRRAWIARDRSGSVIGHIDLRAHPDGTAPHRCLLGMGVHRDARRHGLGTRLLQHALAFAQSSDALEWVDLQVLGGNGAAMHLYDQAGFVRTGEVRDRFRIDGVSLDSVEMTCRVGRSGSA